MKSRLIVIVASVTMWLSFCADVEASHGYSRTVNYANEMIVSCPDRDKATVQVLMEHSDVWKFGKKSVDVRVSKSSFERVKQFFPECSVIVSDLEAHVQEAEAMMFPMKKADRLTWINAVVQGAFPQDLKKCEEEARAMEVQFQQSEDWFREYHNYDDIKKWYKQLASDNVNLVRYVPSIGGRTLDGHTMPAVHITASKNANRKKIYFQCQIHAREWITGATCMYLAKYFVTAYKDNVEQVRKLFNSVELVLVPFVNPDGYVYTWTTDRLWRKNRHHITGAACVGVDINRNFPTGFKKKDISQSCAEDYPGPRSLSEIETENIVNYFRHNAPIVGALDWHSYGQLILRPWGYTNESSPDEDRLRQVSEEMAKRMKKVHNSNYTPEKSIGLYQCYGISADWVYSEDAARTNRGYRAGSFCIELRDETGLFGFVLPADQIIPTAEEVVPGVLYFMEQMVNNSIPYTSEATNTPPMGSMTFKELLRRYFT